MIVALRGTARTLARAHVQRNDPREGTMQIGEIVHYVSYGTPGGEYPSACRAAIVTSVLGFGSLPDVSLAVLNPEGMFFNPAISYRGERDRGGTWHPIH